MARFRPPVPVSASRLALRRSADLTLPLLPLALLLLLGSGCGVGGSAGDSGLDGLKSQALSGIAYDVALPSVRALDAAGLALAQACHELGQAPSGASLSAAQSAWRVARARWNRAEAVLVGPPADLLLATKVDTSPVDLLRIEELLSSDTFIDAALIESLGSTRKGFHALERLLFGGGPAGDGPLELLTVDGDAARRRALALAYAEDIAAVLAEIRWHWEPTGGDLAGALATAGAGSAVYPTRKAAIDVLLNHLIGLLEVLADQRLGRPLGRTSGGLPQAPGAECSLSGNSRVDALEDAQGVRDVYAGSRDGSPGAGLTLILRVTHGAIDDETWVALRALIAALEAIPETLLASAGSAARPQVEAAFDAARDVRIRFVADVTGALGGTLTFSPFDGD